MEYSNPASFFINGNEKESFTFKPRKNPKMFYVQVRSGRHIPISVLIPASSLMDARKILIEALEFKLACLKKDIAFEEKRIQEGYYQGWRERELATKKATEKMIASIKGKTTDYELWIEEIVPNQLFKIGWATNDNI